MHALAHDLRYAGRSLTGNPGFAVVALLSLALGIGANTAVFSVFNAVFLRPLPYPGGERLVMPGLRLEDGDGRVRLVPHWSYPHFRWLREQTTSPDGAYPGILDDVATFVLHDQEAPTTLLRTDGEVAQALRAEYVSTTYLPMLGARPGLGRLFTPDEEEAPIATAVLSEGAWSRLFGADPDILGRVVSLNHHPVTVVGVLRRGFDGLSGDVDVWLPLGMTRALLDEGYLANSEYFWLRSVARLSSGVSREAADAVLPALGASLNQAEPIATAVELTATPLREAHVDPRIRRPLALLLGAVLFVFLIACVNVTNLLLSRSELRRVEIATRLALGAGRGRLIRQFLAEGALLALLGAGAGLLGASWALGALRSLLPTTSGTWTRYAQAIQSAPLDLDGRVLLFTLSLSFAAVMLFALYPGLRMSRLDLRGELARARAGATRAPFNLRRANPRTGLVVFQIGMALVLLVGSSLMMLTLTRMVRADPGFQSRGVLVARLLLPDEGKRESERDFYLALAERLDASPGVESAAIGSPVPLHRMRWGTYVAVEGTDAHRTDYRRKQGVRLHVVDERYADVLGIPVLEGRGFQESDRAGAPQVVLVNRTGAERLWPDGSPVGRRVGLGMGSDGDWATVVGVLEDVPYRRIDAPIGPEFYLTYRQVSPSSVHVLVRGVSAADITGRLREEARALDPRAVVYSARDLEELTAESMSHTRFLTVLLGAFGTVGLLLAAIGIYGVMSFAALTRQRELGIRFALGATRRRVLAFVLVDGLILIAIGLGLGLGASVLLTRFLEAQLYEVRALEPAGLLLAAAGLAGAALLASLLPAVRASRTDPMAVLRQA